jgi:hypothetical protein
MDTQPEALYLADILEHKIPSIECLEVSAKELRRLHEELEAEKKRSADLLDRLFRLDLLNEDLIEALDSFTKSDYIKKQHPKRYANAKAALAKAGESNE